MVLRYTFWLTVMGREFHPSTPRSCITEALSGEGHELTVMWREINPSTPRSCITEALSGEGHELTVVWREFNPSTPRSCITECLNLHIEAVSIIADKARHPYSKTLKFV